MAALPEGSRDALLTAMSPETFAWILRQMNPVEPELLSARAGTRVLSPVLNEVRPHEAMEALPRLPIRQARQVAESLEQPLPDPELLDHRPNTARELMVVQYPTVSLDDLAASAQDGLRALAGCRQNRRRVVDSRELDSVKGGKHDRSAPAPRYD